MGWQFPYRTFPRPFVWVFLIEQSGAPSQVRLPLRDPLSQFRRCHQPGRELGAVLGSWLSLEPSLGHCGSEAQQGSVSGLPPPLPLHSPDPGHPQMCLWSLSIPGPGKVASQNNVNVSGRLPHFCCAGNLRQLGQSLLPRTCAGPCPTSASKHCSEH